MALPSTTVMPKGVRPIAEGEKKIEGRLIEQSGLLAI